MHAGLKGDVKAHCWGEDTSALRPPFEVVVACGEDTLPSPPERVSVTHAVASTALASFPSSRLNVV